MQTLAERNPQRTRERALAEQLDRAINSLRQGKPVESGIPEVAPLLEIAASLIERGRSRQKLLGAQVP